MMSSSSMAGRLSAIEQDNSGQGENTPLVLLHGFGGQSRQWQALQSTLSNDTQVIAFDLPGHGGSLFYPEAGPPKVAAKAVISELEARGIDKAHIVGHSMGGAVAVLVALLAPESVASLTLLAPGGFGPEINIELLLRWADARTKKELVEILPHFFAEGFKYEPDSLTMHADMREQPGCVEVLQSIGNSMTRDDVQGQLPLDGLLGSNIPVTLVWGSQDNILPVSQALALQDKMDVRIIPNIGHMLAEEAPDVVTGIIRDQLARS